MWHPGIPSLVVIGVALLVSLIIVIGRSWNDPATSPAEQKALLAVGANTALAPSLSLLVGVLFRPTLWIAALTALGAAGAALTVLARAHGETLGRAGLYRRVRNLVGYYAYLFFLLTQFPKILVALTWYLGDPGRAQTALLIALLVPAMVSLLSARPGLEEWRKWWPIRQWSALFLVALLALWMWVERSRMAG